MSKNPLAIALAFFLSCLSEVYAGFPINPDEHQETLTFAREFNAVGRIDFIEKSEPVSTASAVLIDASALGLPSVFENRIIASVGHVFSKLFKTFQRGMPREKDTEEAHGILRKYRFCVDMQTDHTQPVVEKAFEIQNVFFCDLYTPHNKKTYHDHQMSFAILKEPVIGVQPLRFWEYSIEKLVGANLYSVGYGVTSFWNSKKFFCDRVKRGGGLTITSADVQGHKLDYSLKTPVFQSSHDNNAQTETYLRTGYDSITLTINGERRALELLSLSKDLNSPELKKLLERYSLNDLRCQFEQEINRIPTDSYTRTVSYSEWHGITFDTPIRLTRAPRYPFIPIHGDSGSPALLKTAQGWFIAGLNVLAARNVLHREPEMSFKDKVIDYLSSNPTFRKLLPKKLIDQVAANDIESGMSSKLYPITTIKDGPQLMQALGVKEYSRFMDRKDGSFFERRWSRIKHNFFMNIGFFKYPPLGTTMISALPYAQSFARKLIAPVKGFDPHNLGAAFYSYALHTDGP